MRYLSFEDLKKWKYYGDFIDSVSCTIDHHSFSFLPNSRNVEYDLERLFNLETNLLHFIKYNFFTFPISLSDEIILDINLRFTDVHILRR